MEQNKEQQPSIAEVLKKHYELLKSQYPPDTFCSAFFAAFAEELASIETKRETEQLRQDIRDLVFQNNSLHDYCRELEQRVEQLTKRCNQESERVVQAEQKARDWQEQCHNYTNKLM